MRTAPILLDRPPGTKINNTMNNGLNAQSSQIRISLTVANMSIISMMIIETILVMISMIMKLFVDDRRSSCDVNLDMLCHRSHLLNKHVKTL